jgi:hypothetical protein
MSNSVYRRCDCRDQNGKGASCRSSSIPKPSTAPRDISSATAPSLTRNGQAGPAAVSSAKAGFKTKGEAQSVLVKLRASLDNGACIEPSKRRSAST